MPQATGQPSKAQASSSPLTTQRSLGALATQSQVFAGAFFLCQAPSSPQASWASAQEKQASAQA